MKVLDLECAHAHVFEGWFASEEDFASQLAQGLMACPVCGDTAIVKKLSAPRLNLGATPEASAPRPAEGASASEAQTFQAVWLQVARKLLEHTEDVGSQFAEEARKMHYGEAPERGIRGQASVEDTQALIEEGIAVLPLPVPDALKGPLH
ncbi:MAG: DUF1178 family protein [Rhodoferax sp.]